MHYKLHGLDSKFAKMPRCNYKIHKSAGLTGEWKSNAESKGPTNCTDSCHKVIDYVLQVDFQETRIEEDLE